MNESRRVFLRASTAYSALGATAGPLALNLSLIGKASAATATDYKALICLFLWGGNDSFNTLIANDPDSWAEYRRWRNQGNVPLALPAAGQPGGILPISPLTARTGRSFALHPRLVNTAALFGAGRLSFIANVGPTSHPMDPRNYATGVAPFLPPALFSHNDQQAVWQSGRPEGAAYGWGGRMGDLLMARNGGQSIFTSISTSGSSVFLSGLQALQYTTNRNVGAEISAVVNGSYGAGSTGAILKRIITRDSSHLFEKELANINRRSLTAAALLKTAALPVGTTAGSVANPTLVYSPYAGQDVENPLAIQLQTVARIIGGSASLGLKRQVFFVGIGGYDTHTAQMPDHDYNLKLVDHAMGYFDGALATLSGQDVRDRVTLFSASDFGRTFSTNGDGTDHGYGAHHFIYGGAVKGGDIYGDFPASGIGHLWDYGKGVLIPQLSVDQYGATIAKWMGITSTSEIRDVFPNLANFSTTDLGFMKP
ncbi:MAG: DUF1501 domain-containing protein [Burkholderiales bacterium]|nr:MAG: DUF1501 domain-containing protein [Betaproteobacteria bacterium]TAG28635.1 MAG: DUF1501 domain-containing protein [Burkholderiales bacterium]TAG47342.1 MAG: DUF1501 domain-containing protein [Betaproteobacteria bacterium]